MPVAATVEVRGRFVRVEVEAVRAVAIALSGRPIAAVDLHVVHKVAEAVASSGEEDRTCCLKL